MDWNKNDIWAALGTAIVVGGITVLLVLCGLSATIPDSEEGLSVNFGNVDLSAGEFEPFAETPANQTQPAAPKPAAPATPDPAPEELITQDEESVDLQADARRKAEEEAKALEEKRKAEEEARRQEAERKRQEQERQASDIRNLAANAFGSARAADEGSQQGSGDTPAGNQGQAQGQTETLIYQGAGLGYGDFDLEGRGMTGGFPRPDYPDINSEGKVMVDIVVNSQGVVTAAGINLKGTDTEDIRLRDAALKAARQARFNAIQGKPDQHGTITYRFRLK